MAHLAAFLNSPNYDDPAVRKTLDDFFNRRDDLPETVRWRMAEEEIDTFVRIWVGSDQHFSTASLRMKSVNQERRIYFVIWQLPCPGPNPAVLMRRGDKEIQVPTPQ